MVDNLTFPCLHWIKDVYYDQISVFLSRYRYKKARNVILVDHEQVTGLYFLRYPKANPVNG